MVRLYQKFFIEVIKQGLSWLDTQLFCQLVQVLTTFLQEVRKSEFQEVLWYIREVKEIVSSKK